MWAERTWTTWFEFKTVLLPFVAAAAVVLVINSLRDKEVNRLTVQTTSCFEQVGAVNDTLKTNGYVSIPLTQQQRIAP